MFGPEEYFFLNLCFCSCTLLLETAFSPLFQFCIATKSNTGKIATKDSQEVELMNIKML